MTNETTATFAEGERPEVSFVVPCYNEAGNISGTILEIDEATRMSVITHFEIVVADDCSSGATPLEIAEFTKSRPYIVALRSKVNEGFGGSFKFGVASASGKYLLLAPGDNQFPASSIAVILKLRGSADIIVPYVTNNHIRPLDRRLFSWGFTTLINKVFDHHMPYYNGLVLHTLDRLRTIEIVTDSFAYQAEALVKLMATGCTCITVGSPIRIRPAGKSSAFKVKNVVEVLKCIWRLRTTIKPVVA